MLVLGVSRFFRSMIRFSIQTFISSDKNAIVRHPGLKRSTDSTQRCICFAICICFQSHIFTFYILPQTAIQLLNYRIWICKEIQIIGFLPKKLFKRLGYFTAWLYPVGCLEIRVRQNQTVFNRNKVSRVQQRMLEPDSYLILSPIGWVCITDILI